MPICWIWGVGEAGEETGVDSLHGHAADEAQCGTETSDALASGGGTPGLKLKTAAGTVSLPFLSECDGACWPPPCNRSASFNPEASAIWIRGTAGAVGIPGAVGIFDRVRREGRAIAAVGVTRRIRIIRVRAELAAVVPLLVIEPRRIGGERIRRRLIAEGTAIGAEGIVDAVRLEGAASSEGIGRGFRIVRIRAQLAEIFRVDGEW